MTFNFQMPFDLPKTRPGQRRERCPRKVAGRPRSSTWLRTRRAWAWRRSRPTWANCAAAGAGHRRAGVPGRRSHGKPLAPRRCLRRRGRPCLERHLRRPRTEDAAHHDRGEVPRPHAAAPRAAGRLGAGHRRRHAWPARAPVRPGPAGRRTGIAYRAQPMPNIANAPPTAPVTTRLSAHTASRLNQLRVMKRSPSQR